MATVRFSLSAKADLLSIGAYKLKNWGALQAERYLSAFEDCLKLLAGKPSLGRPCEWVRPGLHRFEKGRHVFFYRREGDGILVSRILHQSMQPDQQHFEESDFDVSKPRTGDN